MFKNLSGLKSWGFSSLVVGLIGVILRAWGLNTSPLWYDEAFTAILVRLPFMDLIAATAGDVHPPLYYIIVNGFSGLELRIFSLACSIGSMVIFYAVLLTYKLTPGARLLAFCLFSFSAPQLWYAGEARMYAMLEMLILAAWLSVLHRQWSLVGLYATLALWTHNYAPFYLLPMATIAIFGEFLRPRNFYVPPATGPQPEGHAELEKALFAFAAAGVLYLPWFVYAQLGQMGSITRHWTQAVHPLGQFAGLISIVFGRSVVGGLQVVAIIAMAAGIPLLVWWAARNKRLGLVALAFGPAALVVAVSTIWHPIYLLRGLLPSVPFVYILLAESIASAPLYRRLVVVAVLLPLFTVGTLGHIGAASVGSAKYDPQAYRTTLEVMPGAPVVHLSDFSLVTWQATRPELTHYLFMGNCAGEPGSLSDQTRAAMGVKVIDQLPERYTLVGSVGGLSNACLEDQYNRLTSAAEPVLIEPFPYGVSGVWQHGR